MRKRISKIFRLLKMKRRLERGKIFSAQSTLFPGFSIYCIEDKIIAYKGLPSGEISMTFPLVKRGEKFAEKLPLREKPKKGRSVIKLKVKHAKVLRSYVIKSRENPEKEILAHRNVELFVEELNKKGVIDYFCVPRMLGFKINISRGRGSLILEPIVGIPLSRIDFKGVNAKECIELLRVPITLMAKLHKGFWKKGRRIWLRFNDPRFKNMMVAEEFFAGRKPIVYFIDFEKANVRSSQKRFSDEELHDLFVFIGDLGFMFGLRVGKSSILKADERLMNKVINVVNSLIEEYVKGRFNIAEVDREKFMENITKMREIIKRKYGKLEEMNNITVKMASLLLKELKG